MKNAEKQLQRKEALLPNNKPRYIRCYDNGGKTVDSYTVVFTGRYRHKTNRATLYLCMSANPFHPQGFGQHGEGDIDSRGYSHLGKKIGFDQLPEDCQKLVLSDYKDIWDIID
jgi:hypothetical protein